MLRVGGDGGQREGERWRDRENGGERARGCEDERMRG
jgi:hypothetical protein